jgi:hypothetical protein
MKHKEYGSEFYFPIAPQWCLANEKDSSFLTAEISLFFSGRAALHHLLSHGIEHSGWKDVYLPSYYCHEVSRFLIPLPIQLHYYSFNPLHDTTIAIEKVPDRHDCVLVKVSFFGMELADTTRFSSTVLVEDITHNLQAMDTSNAHYCFGSLRKELPMPVGGFCYSPKGHTIPPGVQNHEAEIVTEQKISAMRHKYDYLMGKREEKDTYRTLFAASEEQFESAFTQAALPKNARAILLQLDSNAMLQQKRKNLEQALSELQGVKGLRLLGDRQNRTTFGLLLYSDTPQQRDSLKNHLIGNRIYPAVLWPDQFEDRDIMLENRLLFVHIDFRYEAEDISVITQTIKSHYKHA